MSHPNTELIERFYEAFQRRDAETMGACYADDVVFSDPVFGELRGEEARDMWRMLVQRAQEFSLTFDAVDANECTGSAHWVARYLFRPAAAWLIGFRRSSCSGTDASPSIAILSICGPGRGRRWA